VPKTFRLTAYPRRGMNCYNCLHRHRDRTGYSCLWATTWSKGKRGPDRMHWKSLKLGCFAFRWDPLRFPLHREIEGE
jgi:hypothetical protein